MSDLECTYMPCGFGGARVSTIACLHPSNSNGRLDGGLRAETSFTDWESTAAFFTCRVVMTIDVDFIDSTYGY